LYDIYLFTQLSTLVYSSTNFSAISWREQATFDELTMSCTRPTRLVGFL